MKSNWMCACDEALYDSASLARGLTIFSSTNFQLQIIETTTAPLAPRRIFQIRMRRVWREVCLRDGALGATQTYLDGNQ